MSFLTISSLGPLATARSLMSPGIVVLTVHLHPIMTQVFYIPPQTCHLHCCGVFPLFTWTPPPWILLGLRNECHIPSFRSKEGGGVLNSSYYSRCSFWIHFQNQRLLIAESWKSPLEGFLWPWEHCAPAWGNQKCHTLSYPGSTLNQWRIAPWLD